MLERYGKPKPNCVLAVCPMLSFAHGLFIGFDYLDALSRADGRRTGFCRTATGPLRVGSPIGYPSDQSAVDACQFGQCSDELPIARTSTTLPCDVTRVTATPRAQNGSIAHSAVKLFVVSVIVSSIGSRIVQQTPGDHLRLNLGTPENR